jgi:hypothetical protein
LIVNDVVFLRTALFTWAVGDDVDLKLHKAGGGQQQDAAKGAQSQDDVLILTHGLSVLYGVCDSLTKLIPL